MYSFIKLDQPSFFLYQQLIPENILHRIETLTPEYTLIAFGAIDQNQSPLGICLAIIDNPLRFLEVLHIEVKKEHQNQHIGRTLLASVQNEGKKHNILFSSFIYQKNSIKSFPIEKILQVNQWKGPRPFLIQANFDTLAFDPPLLNLNLSYPIGYKEFLWKDLKEKQREDLLYREYQGHFSKAISPFKEESNIEMTNSLGLEYKDRVIGWMITHRVSPEIVRYTALYVEPSHKSKGPIIKLLTDSMILHKKHPTKWAVIEIPYLQVHPSWIDFVKKRILPYAVKITHFVQAWT
jgi:hypothetical protein